MVAVASEPASDHQKGAQSRSRTGDLRITSALLYLLSYLGEGCKVSNRQKQTKLEYFQRTLFADVAG
jgi:hypothetical protein